MEAKMKIPEIFRKKKEDGKPVFSLEVFPPKRKKNRIQYMRRLRH